MKTHKRITLDQTCYACPEQYDAYLDGEKVGYLRLRHGYFSVSTKPGPDGIFLWGTETRGDGIFHEDERDKMLKKARKKIAKHLDSLTTE